MKMMVLRTLFCRDKRRCGARLTKGNPLLGVLDKRRLLHLCIHSPQQHSARVVAILGRNEKCSPETENDKGYSYMYMPWACDAHH